MPTFITHPLVPVSIASLAGARRVSHRLLLTGIIASVLPDADVIGLKLGIPYGHPMGHRGLSHSIAFAGLMGLLGALSAKKLNASRSAAFLVLFLATLSHGMLDALTSGGLGIGFFSPFSDGRFFFPWRPLKVAPLSLGPFLARRGWTVLRSELIWVWAPILSLGFMGSILRKGYGWLKNR